MSWNDIKPAIIKKTPNYLKGINATAFIGSNFEDVKKQIKSSKNGKKIILNIYRVGIEDSIYLQEDFCKNGIRFLVDSTGTVTNARLG